MLYSELMFQDSWEWLSLKRKVDWHQGFVICDDSELWQSILVDMILGGSKFDDSSFYFNLGVSLHLGCYRSAVITHNLMLLHPWSQLCEDTRESSLR